MTMSNFAIIVLNLGPALTVFADYFGIRLSENYSKTNYVFAILERQIVECVIIVFSGEVSFIHQRQGLSLYCEPWSYCTGPNQIIKYFCVEFFPRT